MEVIRNFKLKALEVKAQQLILRKLLKTKSRDGNLNVAITKQELKTLKLQ